MTYLRKNGMEVDIEMGTIISSSSSPNSFSTYSFSPSQRYSSLSNLSTEIDLPEQLSPMRRVRVTQESEEIDTVSVSNEEFEIVSVKRIYITYSFLWVIWIIFLVNCGINGSFNNGYEHFKILLFKAITEYPQCKPLQKEWWRLFTNMLIHSDMKHIALNTVFIFMNGYVVESIAGHTKTGIYILSGAFGGTLGLAYINRYIPALGASHAGMGLGGAVLGSYLLNYDGYDKIFYRIHCVVGCFYIASDLISYVYDYEDSIGYIGHWIGYLNGFLLSLYLSQTVVKKKWKTAIKQTGFSLFIALNAFLVCDYLFNTYKTNVMNDILQPVEYNNPCLEYIQSIENEK